MNMIKYNILDRIITEGRLEDMIKKYAGKHPELTEEVIRQLSAGDPSGNNKYLDWMCSQRKNYTSEYIINMVKCFHENVNRLSEKNVAAIFKGQEDGSWYNRVKSAPKDINSYESPEIIDLICKYFEEQIPRTASRVKLYEDDNWLVVSPLTHDASCQYGAHSNWCVSTSNQDYYQRYTRDGILVFFLDKKGTNPSKPNANIYKVAVNIKFDRPDLMSWEWYTMEDNRVDAALMMNLMPKNLLEATSKYLDEFLKELEKKSGIDENIIADNSLFYFKKDNSYYVFLSLENWSTASIDSTTEWVKNIDPDGITDQIKGYRERGYPYLKIDMRTGRLPEFNVNSFSWSPITSSRETDNRVFKSKVIESISSRYNSFDSNGRMLYGMMNPAQKSVFLENYFHMFNEAKISKNQNTSTVNLQVGDTIIYREGRRGWGAGTPVRVTRVAEKSIQLSNGKRTARTYSNYKEKVIGIMRVVDDPTPTPTPTTESRWTRKRIV